jgi:hypothetical protein
MTVFEQASIIAPVVEIEKPVEQLDVLCKRLSIVV